MMEADDGINRLEATWEAQRQILLDDNNRIREELQIAARSRDELLMKVAMMGGDAIHATSNNGDGISISSSLMSPPVSGGFTKQDLLLERSAYEAEVSAYQYDRF
jgi:hypothetical protein